VSQHGEGVVEGRDGWILNQVWDPEWNDGHYMVYYAEFSYTYPVQLGRYNLGFVPNLYKNLLSSCIFKFYIFKFY